MASSEPPLAGLAILLVDDTDAVRRLLVYVLADAGARVIAVGSAVEAMRELEQLVPDLLVSDIEMPKESGYALIRKVRALDPDRGGRVPALALTSLATEMDRTEALVSGFDEWLAKPVPMDLLVRTAQRLARRSPVE